MKAIADSRPNRFLKPVRSFAIATLAVLFLLIGCNSQPSQRILFLQQNDSQNWQLLALNPDDERLSTITPADLSVTAYEPSPQGDKIAVSTSDKLTIFKPNGREQNSLPCDFCNTPVWSSDNRRLIYEKDRQLFWWDTAAKETAPVFSNQLLDASHPTLSFDDQKLAYTRTDPATEAAETVIFDFATGEQTIVPNLGGISAEFAPHTHDILFLDMIFLGEQFSVHILKTDGLETTDLTQLATVEDGAPKWSPDGSQISFGRKQSRTSMGRQLHLIDADGNNLRPLTNNADIHHGPANWSPDGTQLLFQTFNLVQQGSTPQIALYDLKTDDLMVLAENASRPQWLISRRSTE